MMNNYIDTTVLFITIALTISLYYVTIPQKKIVY